MNPVIKQFNELNIQELYELLKLRFDVFVLEQQSFYPELDGNDEKCLHVYTKVDNKIVAYLRILPKGVTFSQASIGRFVVDPKYRSHGYGKMLFKLAVEYITQEMGETEIRIEGQTYLKNFYGGFGFVQCSDEFLDGGISHIEMIYKK